MRYFNTIKSNREIRKLIAVTAVFAALVAASMIAFYYGNARNISRHNREYLIDSTEKIAGQIDDLLSEGYDNIKILAELLDRTLTEPNVDVGSLKHLLDNSVFDYVGYIDKDGIDRYLSAGPIDVSDREYYQNAMQDNSGMELIFKARSSNENILLYYAPVHFGGKPIGALIGVYRAVGKIIGHMEAEYYGHKATSYLCTPEGRIVACTAGIDCGEEKYAPGIAGDDVELAARLESAIEEGRTITFGTEGNMAGACLMKIAGCGWYLVQIFPEEANRSIIESGNTVGLQLLLALFLIFTALTGYILRYSRRKEREMNIQQEKVRNAMEASKMKSSFVQNMSHDIRTPLNAIVGYSQLLGMPEMYLSDAERAEFSEYINSSADMLTMLLDDVLNISDIEHGILKINKAKVSCNEICRKAVNCASMRVPVGVKLFYTSEVDANYMILSDAKRVQQILVNFLTNACKHTAEGQIHVHCSLSENPGSVTFSVTDTGDGVPADKADEIFNRFTTLDAETGGHGMGLSICLNLSELLGGKVALDRSYTDGARFILVIPIEEP